MKYIIKILFSFYLFSAIIGLTNCEDKNLSYFDIIQNEKENKEVLINKFDAIELPNNSTLYTNELFLRILGNSIVGDSVDIHKIEDDSKFYITASLNTPHEKRIFLKLECDEATAERLSKSPLHYGFIAAKIGKIEVHNNSFIAETIDHSEVQIELPDKIILLGKLHEIVPKSNKYHLLNSQG